MISALSPVRIKYFNSISLIRRLTIGAYPVVKKNAHHGVYTKTDKIILDQLVQVTYSNRTNYSRLTILLSGIWLIPDIDINYCAYLIFVMNF